jgi:hypothetical protein
VIVKNALTLTDGYLYTSALNLLTLNDNATATAGSNASFVDGPMKKIGNDAFTFPLGDSAVWAPLAITAPALTTDAFTAEYFGDPQATVDYPCTNCGTGVHHVSSVEYWNIDRVTGTSTPNVTLYFKDMSRSNIIDLNDLIFTHYDGSQWVQMGTNHGVSDGVNMCHITGTGFTSYSPVTPASANGTNALPVNLITFQANAVEEGVEVLWSTASEINNNYFTIQRTVDFETMETVGRIEGAGNSTITRNYRVVDEAPVTGTAYYRLVQNDFNGMSETFGWARVMYAGHGVTSQVLQIEVQPNPASSSMVNVNIQSKRVGQFRIEVFNTTGGLILREPVYLTEGHEQVTLDLAKRYPFTQGIYIIKVTGDRDYVQTKLVIE